MILTWLSVVLLLLVIQWLTCSPFKWQGKGIKWLLPWPLFGNSIATLTQTYYDFWLDFYRKYEGHNVVGFHLFSCPTLLARDPDMIKQISVAEGNNFLSRGLFSNEKDPFHRNLLFVYGQEWRTMRSKITPYLSSARIKAMFPQIEQSVGKLCQQINIESKKGPIDMDELTVKLSTEIIASAIFGVESDTFTNPDSFIFTLQNELLGFLFGLRILIGFLSPTIYKALNFKILSNSSTEKVTAFVQKVLDLRIKGVGIRPDFMQGMVELYKNDQKNEFQKEEYYSDGTKVARFNYRGVASQCMIMFAASTENIGRNLGFLFYELAKNQHVQDRLRKEVMKVRDSNNGQIGYDQLSDLKYMDMVVSESLRKYPPVITISRKATSAIKIGDLEIDKDTLIAIPILGIHRDPKYYPDPDKFDPERFAPGIERQSGTYIPFGLGPKGCVGTRMTQVELKLTISEVLTKFKLEPCLATPKQIKYHFGPTLRSSCKIKLNAIPL